MASPPTPPPSLKAASPAPLSPISPLSPPATAPPSPSLFNSNKNNNGCTKQIPPDGQDLDTRLASTDQSLTSAETNDKMAPRNPPRGGRSPGPPRREADFSGVITPSQKLELIAMLNATTNAMQDEICAYFERTEKPFVNLPASTSVNRIAPLKDLKDLKELKDLKDPKDIKKFSAFKDSCVDMAGDSIQDVTEAYSVQGELKKEAVAAFQKWLLLIIKRVTDISAVKEQPSPALQSQGKFSNGKQPARGSGRGGGRTTSTPGRQGGPGGGRAAAPDPRNSPVPQVAAQLPPGAQGLTLQQLSLEKRQLLLHTLLLLIVSLDSYPAYSRVLMARVAAQLRLPQRLVADEEMRIARGLSLAADSVFHEEGVLKRNEDGKRERRPRPSGPPPSSLAPVLEDAKIGSIAGGSGIGTTAAASILGTMGTLSDGGLATCIFFGLCGPKGSPAKTLDIFTKDIQDVGLLPLHGSNKLQVREGNTVAAQDRRLRLTIAVSCWAMPDEDAIGPWRVLGDKTEAYTLAWEHEALEKVGSSMETVMSSTAWKNAKEDFTKRNIFANTKNFAWPRSILKVSKIADNPWSVGMVRADKVGIALADAIVNKVQGERGVSLLGFGLGARAIYTCLMSLSERRLFGQVENVIMMGTPAPSSKCVWTAIRSVVTGRVINVFSENDHILAFLHRTGCIQFGVAGLERIDDVKGVENVNASKPIDSHLAYPKLVPRILKDIGWEDLDPAEVKKVEAKQASAGDGGRVRGKEKAASGQAQANAPGRNGRGRPNRKKMDALEGQFKAMNIVH